MTVRWAVRSDVDAVPHQPDRTAETYLEPAYDMLAVVLDGIGGLTGRERAVIHQGAASALHETLLGKVSGLSGHRFALAEDHPELKRRLGTVVDNRMAAAITFAERFAADRGRLSEVDEQDPGELCAVSFDPGDGHRGGHTAVLLTCARGRLVYRPWAVDAERALAGFLARALPDEPDPIRVPRVLVRDAYGWAEHVEHRYCAGAAELRRFHRNLGRWLAVMRLLGGTVLHPENLVAAGPVPVVVGCDTLFTRRPPATGSGYGAAVGLAHDLAGTSVLGTGLLPGHAPAFLDAPAGHLPAPDPVLGRYWEHVVTGFAELTDRLREHDRAGELAGWLALFADAPVRAVARDAETYAELSRLLWHPTALREPESATAAAVDLLTRHAATAAGTPTDPYVIAAEVGELLDGDVPLFTTTPAMGLLLGPRGTTFGERTDLVAAALDRWRAADPGRDRSIVQAGVVAAYLDEGWQPDATRQLPSTVDSYRLDRRRRELAARVVGQLAATAVTGPDDTVSWVTPVLEPTGWTVRPLSHDLYGGTAGVAVLLAGYLREQAAGRADEVPGLDRLLKAALHTMRLADRQGAAETGTPGGYLGLGSRICGWLLLRRLGAIGDDALERAAALAEQVPRAAVGDHAHDVLTGRAGAIVPLLRLAEHTGERRFTELAAYLGDQLVAAATPVGAVPGTEAVCWPTARFPHGVGGFAHGATGIGWALARLAAHSRNRAHARTAAAAFAYEAMLYDPALGGWRDLSGENLIGTAWCHGSTGIGLAAVDLLRGGGSYADDWRDTVRMAAASSWDRGTGRDHTLCHGDLGAWELVTAAQEHGLGPAGLDRSAVDAHVVGAIEEFGVVTAPVRDAFVPGLLAGAGGVAYQLLRLHPDCRLPSVLLPDPGPPLSRAGSPAARASAGPGRSSSR